MQRNGSHQTPRSFLSRRRRWDAQYSAVFQEEYRGSSLSHGDRIAHSATYNIASDRKVVAVQLGFVEFNVFNEFLGKFRGFDMEGLAVRKPTKGLWYHTPYSAFSFQTGVAYVAQVRFDSGEIWKADLGEIASELQKIEADFDVAELKKRDQPDTK